MKKNIILLFMMFLVLCLTSCELPFRNGSKNITDEDDVVTIDPGNTEDPKEPGNTENPKDPGNTEDPKEPGNTENPKEPGNTEDPKDPGNTENPKDPGNTEDPKEPGNTEEPKEPGNTEDPKEPGNTEDPKEPGNTEDPKDPGNTEDPKEPGNTEDPKEPGNTEEPKEPGNEVTIVAKGYNEGINLVWLDKDPYKVVVRYKKSSETTYKILDKELVRVNNATTLVADIVGIEAGTYDVKITTNENYEVDSRNIKVSAIDRSGYAHFAYTDGVGAYTDKGVLKSGANVIYVSNATKNTVEYKIGSKTYKGIGNILAKASEFSTPVVIRILDEVYCAQYKYKKFTPRKSSLQLTENEIKNYFSNELESNDIINGIINRCKIAGNGVFNSAKTYYDDDSYFNMMDVVEASNITVEGIGTSAILKQWGFTFKKCNSIEVRNLTFTDYPEDACSFEGSSGSQSKYGNYFVHHNTFNRGKNNWDLTWEQDKGAGDGATDVKYCHNVTLAYNNYNKCKKTGLVGGSDSNLQYNITFHHNYYNEVNSRLPLGRQANMHMYNNYYYKTGSNLDLRANAYAFTEANYFESATAPGKIKGGAAIKSWNDIYDNVKSDNKSIKVKSRTQVVENKCEFGTDFDTNSSLFYYDSVNKVTKVSYLTTANQAKIDCPKMAGVLKLS